MRRRCKGNYCTDTALDGKLYCEKCQKKAELKFNLYSALYDAKRRIQESRYRAFYSSKAWRTFREGFLAEKPFCFKCNRFATDLHHIVPLKEDWEKRLDAKNIMPLCKACHSKTELEERNKKSETKKESIDKKSK